MLLCCDRSWDVNFIKADGLICGRWRGGSGFFANEIWESYIRKGLFSRGGLIIGIVRYYSERECVFLMVNLL